MQNNFSIAVDLDGVIACFVESAKPYVEKVIGKRLPVDYQPPDWGWGDAVTDVQWTEVWKLIRQEKGFWLGLKPFKENVDELYSFINRTPQCRVYYCTSRIQTGGQPPQAQCEMWLEDQGLLPRGEDRVIISRGEDKHRVYKELQINYSIDDKPETIYDCLYYEGHMPFLLDRSYNRNWQLPRVYSMEEFLHIVGQLESVGKRTASVGGVIA